MFKWLKNIFIEERNLLKDLDVEKQPTLIYKRLDNLFNSICELELKNIPEVIDTSCNNFVLYKSKQNNILIYIECYNYYDTTKQYTLKYYTTKDSILKMNYSLHSGPFFENKVNHLFKITASKYETEVKPYLNQNFSAHDIDLCLYEFEKLIEDNIGYLPKILETHENEIKKLENGFESVKGDINDRKESI